MPTLILPPRTTADCDAVAGAARRAGWDIFHATSWRFDTANIPHDPVLYADPLFADVAARALDLALLDPPLDWLTHLPGEFIGRRTGFTTLSAAREIKGPLFFKPADDKCFEARVYGSGAELFGDDLLPPDLPVVYSEPVVWASEFRCFVLAGAVQTLSVYLRNGELAQAADGTWPATAQETEEARNFADRVLSDNRVTFPPAFVLDVGWIDGNGWAVIEANAGWGSGIYGCDPDAVLPVVRRACVQRTLLTEQDARWMRPAIVLEE